MSMNRSYFTEPEAAHASEIGQLGSLYEFKNRHQVVAFLVTYPFLIPFLFEVRQKITEYFGSHTQAALKILVEGGESELFVLILTRLPSDDALDILDKFDQEWWFAASEKTDCRLCVDVEYIQ